MTWEWVAPTGTAVVGLAGIAATYLAGKRQAITAREVAEQQSRTMTQAQREERNQRRIEAAYPPLLDVLAEGSQWAWRVDVFVTGDSTDERPPAMPNAVKRLTERGSHTAVLSPRVAALLEEWTMGAGKALSAARRLGYERERVGVVTPTWSRIGDGPEFALVLDGSVTPAEYLDGLFRKAHSQMRSAEYGLREQIWRELRGEDDGHAKAAER